MWQLYFGCGLKSCGVDGLIVDDEGEEDEDADEGVAKLDVELELVRRCSLCCGVGGRVGAADVAGWVLLDVDVCVTSSIVLGDWSLFPALSGF